MPRAAFCLILAPAALLAAGCGGPQSALDPAGRDAERIAELFFWLAAGAGIVWIAVIALGLYAGRFRTERHGRLTARLLIVGGGAVLPTVVLTGYLTYGLALLPRLLEPGPPGGPAITVSGEQWWWRVRYPAPGGGTVETANEIRLPVGERAELRLESPDVIHSFWVPSLAGKIDMIPGRVNRLALEPTKPGVYRGACAEYCGASHAFMSFYVVVMERPAYDAWLAREASPARAPSGPLQARGRDVFLASGCGACHAVRGTEADGTVGPDLTHVGGRVSLAAGVLPNDPDTFRRWIARAEALKPGVHMPSFGMLPPEELRALAAYLDDLE